MVVIHHARKPTPGLWNPLANYPCFSWGVDIFFVISGLIMYVAARNENPIDFLKRRLIRVIPLYWAATLTLFIIKLAIGVISIDLRLITHLLKSMLFIPHHNLSYPNEIWPYLIPGWTLNYEMFFYFVFFIALLSKRLLPSISCVILLLTTIGYGFSFNNPILLTFTRPILLEFLVGAWIASVYLKGGLRSYMKWLLPVGFTGLFALPIAEGSIPLIWGQIICSAMIVAGAASLKSKGHPSVIGKLLGDASYSIYLTHTVISLSIAKMLWSHIPTEGWIQFSSWIAISLCVSAGIGVVVYQFIERPLMKWLREKWLPAQR